MTLKANGWTQARIAQFMGCDEKTLRKNFSRELDMASDFVEGMALQVLNRRAMDGHVPALRDLLDRVAASSKPKAAKPELRPEPLGKKAAQNEAAKKAPSAWNDLLN